MSYHRFDWFSLKTDPLLGLELLLGSTSSVSVSTQPSLNLLLCLTKLYWTGPDWTGFARTNNIVNPIEQPNCCNVQYSNTPVYLLDKQQRITKNNNNQQSWEAVTAAKAAANVAEAVSFSLRRMTAILTTAAVVVTVEEAGVGRYHHHSYHPFNGNCN